MLHLDGPIMFVMAVLLVLIVSLPGCTSQPVIKVPPKSDRPYSQTDDWADVDQEARKEPIDKPTLRSKTKAGFEKSRDVVDLQVDALLEAQHQGVETIEDLASQIAVKDKKIAKLEAKSLTGPLVLYIIGGLAIVVGIIVVAFMKDVATGGVIGLGGAAICVLAWILTSLSGYVWVLWVIIPVLVAGAVLFLLATSKGKKVVDRMRTTVDTLVSSIGHLPEEPQAMMLENIRAIRKEDATVVKAEVKASKRRTKTK